MTPDSGQVADMSGVRPRLLDLFCGAGGCGVGYARAGFDVTGVDIAPQPNYPYPFRLADALAYVQEHGRDFDAIHASPPCQAYSTASGPYRVTGKVYPDLLPITRAALQRTGVPWVIENVPGAPMRADFRICGCQVGLPGIRRERWFETSWNGFDLMPAHHHAGPVVSVVGHGSPSGVRAQFGQPINVAYWRTVMGIDWMTRDELSQAIPPAYTHFVGGHLLAHLAATPDAGQVTDTSGVR